MIDPLSAFFNQRAAQKQVEAQMIFARRQNMIAAASRAFPGCEIIEDGGRIVALCKTNIPVAPKR